jgi:hypothetical protein
MRLAAIVLVLSGCGQDAATPDGGVDAGPVAQGSEPTGDLIVNEVAPLVDGPDWIELLNRSDAPVDLCGFFVTDGLDRLDHYLALGGAAPPDPCTEQLLDSGARLIIYADDDPEQGPDHAPFKLTGADEVHVLRTTGITEDSLLYLYPADGAGRSLARIPDGEGLFWPAEPTPAAANPAEAP